MKVPLWEVLKVGKAVLPKAVYLGGRQKFSLFFQPAQPLNPFSSVNFKVHFTLSLLDEIVGVFLSVGSERKGLVQINTGNKIKEFPKIIGHFFIEFH